MSFQFRHVQFLTIQPRWQTVRYKDVSKEKEKKEEALMKLTTRERELRKRIEDMLDPQDKNNSNTTSTHPTAKETTVHAPLKTKAVNGHPKSKGATSTADNLKKGKKRKAPAA
jgi:COMPASS component SPP1